MITSMTGYCEKIFHGRTFQVKIAVKTLNHRFFDWNYRGSALGEVENVWREICQGSIKRGRVEVTADLIFRDDAGWDVAIHDGLLRKIIGSLAQTSRKLGQPLEVSPEIIFRIPQLMELRRRDLAPAEKEFLVRCFERTLAEAMKTRRREGRETAKQLSAHLAVARKSLDAIKSIAGNQPAAIREKLKLRWKEAKLNHPPEEGKLEEEAAAQAQKADITEEIIRLMSHLRSFSEVLRRADGEPAGKMLDFLAQELAREANTIGSKSQSIDITRETLAIKGEVESLRQHVQNIE